jgi:hypothetical protein
VSVKCRDPDGYVAELAWESRPTRLLTSREAQGAGSGCRSSLGNLRGAERRMDHCVGEEESTVRSKRYTAADGNIILVVEKREEAR